VTNKIFYDLGYNLGKATSCFLNNTYWMPESNTPDVFKHSNEGSIVYAFEPDKRLHARSILNLDEYPNIHLSGDAVWIEDLESIEFNLGSDAWYEGSSLFEASGRKKEKHSAVSEVGAVDFSDFLKTTHDPNMRHVVKMDIEGAEYAVLRKLIKDGTIYLIDDLFVEFHGARNLGADFGEEQRENWLFLKKWFAENNIFISKELWKL
tara:strand:+ start:670 stop:1290 length:621 start_codon:yes stop_codon:yes gene_type:complete